MKELCEDVVCVTPEKLDQGGSLEIAGTHNLLQKHLILDFTKFLKTEMKWVRLNACMRRLLDTQREQGHISKLLVGIFLPCFCPILGHC